MADKPSNNRKRVDYQPARNGQAARWRIEERESSKEQSAKEPARKNAERKDVERKEVGRKEPARTGDAEETLRTERSRKGSAHGKATRQEASRKSPVREKAASKSPSFKESSREKALRDKSGQEKSKAPREPRTQKERAQARAAERRKVQADRSRNGKPAADKDEAKPQREERTVRSGRAERIVAEQPQRPRHSTSDRTRGQVMEAMLPQTSRGGARGAAPGITRNAIIIAVLVIIVVVFFLWHPWSRGADVVVIGEGDAPLPSDILEERFESLPSYGTVKPVDFNAIEEDGYTAGFVLVPGGVVTDYSIYETEPELSDESAKILNDALAPFTENDVITAFLLMDIQTGRGFARNIDMKLYGASSIKGPYCGYLLKQYVDNGDTKITDAFASGYMTESLGYERSGSDTLKNLIQETIVDSSNDAFAALRVSFSDATFANWLASVDVDQRVAYDTWFPFNTVRNMAKLWMETYYYLQTNSDAANTLREFMGETTKSFMREALTGVRILDEKELVEPADSAAVVDVDANSNEASTNADAADSADALAKNSTLRATGSLGQNLTYAVDHSIDVLLAPEMTVIDKAGWNIDNDSNYDALVDCGIVSCNGRDYLLCVMCDAGYTDNNVNMFEKLIAAVFAARQDLA